jgi:tRNA nucleotidyltransferase (CCA-adding enzyme)
MQESKTASVSRFEVLMDIYLVGGAVRDALLNYPTSEQDWVVVGASPQEMLDRGYQQVGKDFPVFLHPKTKDEYALARTERKWGHGYTGFAVHCDPAVTLEQDLLRRDLTVNAMARTDSGEIVDPYGGQKDLAAKILRHVSDAFVEDPLRVLRTARFAARYAHLGFTVAPETMELMANIVSQDELAHLPAERIWVETERALGEPNPEVFVQVLRDCGALARLLPEVEALFGVPQTAQYHPEIDTGIHTLMTLQQAAQLTAATDVRFALLVHDLGKGSTPASEWPQHIAHEHRGLKLVKGVCKRLKAPGQHRDLALKVCEYHTHCHRALELRGKTLLKLLNATDALRRPDRFEAFLLACEADARGREGLEQRDYPQADYLRRALNIAQEVTAAHFDGQSIEGKALGEAITAERVRLLDGLRNEARNRPE